MLNGFNKYLKEKNLSPQTIEAYLYTVEIYQTMYKRIDKDSVLSFKGYLLENFKVKTVNLRIQALNKYLEYLNIPRIDGEYIYGKGDVFSVAIIFKYLLSKDDFRLFMNELSYELDHLEGVLHSISIDNVLDRMGFPNNYRSLLDVE
jgi:hypothetical protein